MVTDNKHEPNNNGADLKVLYSKQSELNKLPLPELVKTLNKYKNELKLFASADTLQTSLKYVDEFLVNEGPKLQARLETELKSKDSWFYDLWNDYAYLTYRESIVTNVSYFYGLKQPSIPEAADLRGARIIQATQSFRKAVVEETMQPDVDKLGYWCMHSYKYMFNACRQPGKFKDTVETYYDQERPDNYVIVLRDNRYFKLELSFNGRQLNTAEIESRLKQIRKLTDEENVDGKHLGLLTTQDRDRWFEAKQYIEQLNPKNKESLDLIAKSNFIVILDRNKPTTKEDTSYVLWYGTGDNRYFDKPIEFVIFDNAKAGFIGEHAMMDGTPTIRLVDFVCDSLAKDTIDHGSNIVEASLPQPNELEFHLDAEVDRHITLAREHFEELVSKVSLNIMDFQTFGKDYIKTLNISPDSFAQLMIQLSVRRLHGRFFPTYEAATTRRFLKGRTEVSRTVQPSTIAFVEAKLESKLPKHELAKLARQAGADISNTVKRAMQGQGIDRHLLALKSVTLQDEETPAMFKDSNFAFLNTWYISTSPILSEYFDEYGWGAVVPGGYGFGYMVKKKAIHFNLGIKKPIEGSTIASNGDKMIKLLEESALELQQLLSEE